MPITIRCGPPQETVVGKVLKLITCPFIGISKNTVILPHNLLEAVLLNKVYIFISESFIAAPNR